MSAGSCVLGSQFVLLQDLTIIPIVPWGIGAFTWLLLIYGFLMTMTIIEHKPTLPNGINGTWLLIIVSTQSLTILGALLTGDQGFVSPAIAFSLLANFLLGCIFYFIMITLIFYRFMFFKFDPEELTPSYWVNMGVEAITTLAGITLMNTASSSALLAQVEPMLRGPAIMFWIMGTCWIPLLLLLGVWRHMLRQRYRFAMIPAIGRWSSRLACIVLAHMN